MSNRLPGRGASRRTPYTSGRTRARVAACAVALALPVLGGCGFGVQTNQVYQPAVGANVRSGTVDVLAAVIVSPKAGSGVFLATLVDNSDTTGDKLVSIEGQGVEIGTVPQTTLPSQVPVDLASSGGVPVTGKSVDTLTSNYVKLKLSFANSDPVEVNVPVVVNDGPYKDFGVTPSAPNSVAANGATGAAGSSASPSASPSEGS